MARPTCTDSSRPHPRGSSKEAGSSPAWFAVLRVGHVQRTGAEAAALGCGRRVAHAVRLPTRRGGGDFHRGAQRNCVLCAAGGVRTPRKKPPRYSQSSSASTDPGEFAGTRGRCSEGARRRRGSARRSGQPCGTSAALAGWLHSAPSGAPACCSPSCPRTGPTRRGSCLTLMPSGTMRRQVRHTGSLHSHPRIHIRSNEPSSALARRCGTFRGPSAGAAAVGWDSQRL